MRQITTCLILLCLSCTANQVQQAETIKIIPYEDGFEIYAPNDSLIMEFTPLNKASDEISGHKPVAVGGLMPPTGDTYLTG